MQAETITKAKPRMNKQRFIELFSEWRTSDEPQKDFCRRKGINHHTFVYWRTKLNSEIQQQNVSFAEARISGPAPISNQQLRLILPCGTQVLVPGCYGKAMLSDLLQALGLSHVNTY